MTIAVANVANTNTFDYWRVRTNELAHAMTNYTITTNSNTTVGNATVNGYITATGFIVSNTTSNATISIPTANQYSSGQHYLNANGSWVQVPAYSISLQTSGAGSPVMIDSYNMSYFNAMEYMIHTKDNDANGYVSTKLITVHDGANVFITEYATVTSNSSFTTGVLKANANTTHVKLYVTPTSANTDIRILRLNT